MRCIQGWERLHLAALVGLIALTGCGHVISASIRQQADTTVSLTQLRADPTRYTDRLVIFAGELLRTQNVADGTLLEVLQKPLGSYDRPRVTDRTEGRFMALCPQYLDPAIYTAGREITVAGRVLGARKGQVGEYEYTYPLLSCLELHLWPQATPVAERYMPYPWWHQDPWFWRPYHPYWRFYHYR